MNKLELQKLYEDFINNFQLYPTDCLIGFGGAMVMYGLRDRTNDLDISVNQQVFDWFKGLKNTRCVTHKSDVRVGGRCETHGRVDAPQERLA